MVGWYGNELNYTKYTVRLIVYVVIIGSKILKNIGSWSYGLTEGDFRVKPKTQNTRKCFLHVATGGCRRNVMETIRRRWNEAISSTKWTPESNGQGLAFFFEKFMVRARARYWYPPWLVAGRFSVGFDKTGVWTYRVQIASVL